MKVAGRRTAAPTLASVIAMLLVGTPATRSQEGERDAHTPSQLGGDVAAEPCELPDLDGVETAVARQLEEAATRARSAAAGASAATLRAAALGTLGRHLHAYGMAAPAERCYREAARLAPQDPAWPHLLGVLFEEQGRAAEARQQYGFALRLTPGALHTLARLAEIEREGGDVDTAERLFRQVLERRPTDAAALAGMGQIALSRRDYEAAVEYLGAALAAMPAADSLRVPLALAHRQLGHADAARHHLEHRGAVGVTVADPELARVEDIRAGEVPNLLRGRQAFAVGDYAAAVEAFTGAVEAAPDSLRARLNLAAALGEIGRTEEALSQIDRVLELDPENARAHFNRGILLVRAGRDEPAVDSLLEAARLDPLDADAPLQAAAALARSGRSDEALRLYEAVIQTHPDRPEAWLGSADLLLRRGDPDAALARLEEAHRVLPGSLEVTAALARLRSAL